MFLIRKIGEQFFSLALYKLIRVESSIANELIQVSSPFAASSDFIQVKLHPSPSQASTCNKMVAPE